MKIAILKNTAFNKTFKRHMMGGGGKAPKKLGETVAKLLENKTTTIQTQGMTMQPFRPTWRYGKSCRIFR